MIALGQLRAQGYDSSQLTTSVAEILASTRLLSMATVTPSGDPWINNAYFASDSSYRLYLITAPSSVHVINLATHPSVAISVANSEQSSEGGKRGLQAFGSFWEAAGEDLRVASAVYGERFGYDTTSLVDDDLNYRSDAMFRFYVVDINRFKIFDEQTFGAETWVEAQVERRSN